MTTLYLASGSPRRQELLTQLGLAFERLVPGIEEQRQQRLRYLLLLWGADRNGANPMTPEEVHRVANERLMQMMPQVLPAPDAMGPQMPAPATGLTPPQPSQPAGGQ